MKQGSQHKPFTRIRLKRNRILMLMSNRNGHRVLFLIVIRNWYCDSFPKAWRRVLPLGSWELSS